MHKLQDSKILPVVMIMAIIFLLGGLVKQKMESGEIRFSFLSFEYGKSARTLKTWERELGRWDNALARREDELRARAMAEYKRLKRERGTADKGRFILERDFELSNTDQCFGVHMEVFGTASVYENVVEVFVEEAVLFRSVQNIHRNPAIYVSGVEMELAGWVQYDEGRWNGVSQSLRFPIDQTLSNTNERITLTGLTFSIPFETHRPIEEHWLLMSAVSPSEHGDGYHYAHTVPTLFK